MRELIHRGKIYRQPEGTIGGSWVELTVLLFDNYIVISKLERLSRSARREERQLRFMINRRPIPLELLSLGNFDGAPRARATRTLFSVGNSSHGNSETDGTNDRDPSDSKTVWPFSISSLGPAGGQYVFWTDSSAARADWLEKLQHGKVLRAEVNDANKVFEFMPLSVATFFMAPSYAVPRTEGDSRFTGRVTCSAPFRGSMYLGLAHYVLTFAVTPDGRALIAVGCEEGVWIGLRNDPRSLRKVLHVKAVTNIAVLEEFGIFLVLQDKASTDPYCSQDPPAKPVVTESPCVPP